MCPTIGQPYASLDIQPSGGKFGLKFGQIFTSRAYKFCVVGEHVKNEKALYIFKIDLDYIFFIYKYGVTVNLQEKERG